MSDWQEVKDGILKLLEEGLADVQQDLKEDWKTYGKDIANDALVFARGAADGSIEYQQNLKHLQAQAVVLGSLIALREQERVTTFLQRALTMALSVLVPALKQFLAP